MKMNEPSSGLEIDLGEYSDTEILELIEKLRASRLSDIERSRRSVATKTVRTMTGDPNLKMKMVPIEVRAEQQVDALIKASGTTVDPEKRKRMIAKLIEKAKAGK